MVGRVDGLRNAGCCFRGELDGPGSGSGGAGGEAPPRSTRLLALSSK
jgi:hypothetical protein